MPKERSATPDLASKPTSFVFWWGAPIGLSVVTGLLGLPLVWTAAIFATVFAWMGTGCVLNALRCRRLHCYVSGPSLLLGAAAAATIGLGALPRESLPVVVWATTALAVLSFVPEALFGRYRGS